MAVITNKARQLYPRDGDGAITIKDIEDTVKGATPAPGITKVELDALTARVKALEDAA